MKETMGQVIRRLRKEHNLTQEELAEQLNVSNQAVSKWECGDGMPDISQVIPLASVFGVTTDVLFGIEGTNAVDEGYRIVNEAFSMEEYGRIETYLTAYDRMIEGLKKYPNNLILLNRCVGLGLSLCLPENGWIYAAKRADEIASETERQAKLIIAYSKNASDIMRAHQVLIYLYSSQGEFDKASSEAANYPERTDFTLHSHMARVAETKGDNENVIRHLGIDNSYALQSLEDNIACIGKAYFRSGRYSEAAETYEMWFRIMKAIFGEKFPSFHDFDSGDLYILLAEAYLASGEHDKAMDCVENSVMYYLDLIGEKKTIWIDYLADRTKASLFDTNLLPGAATGSVVKHKLTEKLSSPALDLLRSNSRFKILCEKVNNL